jgi:hypothetical protein
MELTTDDLRRCFNFSDRQKIIDIDTVEIRPLKRLHKLLKEEAK